MVFHFFETVKKTFSQWICSNLDVMLEALGEEPPEQPEQSQADLQPFEWDDIEELMCHERLPATTRHRTTMPMRSFCSTWNRMFMWLMQTTSCRRRSKNAGRSAKRQRRCGS
jgi:hypothetical protein